MLRSSCFAHRDTVISTMFGLSLGHQLHEFGSPTKLILSRIWESQLLLSARFSLHQIRQPLRVLPNPSTFDNPRAFEPLKVVNLRTFEPSKVINLRAFNLQPSKGTLVLQLMRDLTQKGSGIHPDNTSHSPLMLPRPIQPNHSTHQYIQ